MSFYSNAPVKLVPARQTGLGTELFIVEGDSAARSVAQLREGQIQAVLPMQGKPMNALKASATTVTQHPLFAALIDSMGAGCGATFDLTRARYHKLLLLFDPDADGIHCGALLLMFIGQFMRPLLDAGRVEMIHAPWLQLTLSGQAPQYAFSPAQAEAWIAQYAHTSAQSVRYRGLSGIDAPTLQRTCLDPVTRYSDGCTRVLSMTDAQLAMQVFGGVGSFS